jgi:hypothetical protein
MVEVYLMRVTHRLKQWPEKGERKLSWLLPDEAVTVIQEPGAVPLLRRFAELLHCGSDVERMRGIWWSLVHRAALWSLQSFNSRLDPPPHSATLQIAVVQHAVNHAPSFNQRVGPCRSISMLAAR